MSAPKLAPRATRSAPNPAPAARRFAPQDEPKTARSHDPHRIASLGLGILLFTILGPGLLIVLGYSASTSWGDAWRWIPEDLSRGLRVLAGILLLAWWGSVLLSRSDEATRDRPVD